jgi:hypothetical protein
MGVACRWFSPGTLVSSTNKTDHHNIAEILLKRALNTTTLAPIYFVYTCIIIAVLLVEETSVPGENHLHATSH